VMGIGRLLVNATRAPELSFRSPTADFLAAITPPRADFSWPLARAIPEADIDRLVFSVVDIFHKAGSPMRQSRTRVSLRIVDDHDPLATILRFETPLRGQEFVDLTCGKCAAVLCEGLSLEAMRSRFAVESNCFSPALTA
jgi:hypothetical protein